MSQLVYYMNISSFGHSDKGKVRKQNEDMFLVDDRYCIYAVADGLGGLPAGKTASNLAIQYLEDAIKTNNFPENLDYQNLFDSINRKVYEEGLKINQEIGIGTTLTVLRFNSKDAIIGHVGDSAVLLFRRNSWIQLTTDHTMEEEMRARLTPGEDVYIPEYFSHTLTRCIGQLGELETDVYKFSPRAGDRFLICSDGITKTMTEEEIHQESMRSPSPKAMVMKLIEIANERGGPDNATGIAIFMED